MSLQRFVIPLVCCAFVRTAAADPVVDGQSIHKGIGIEIGGILEGGFSQYAYHYGDGLKPNVQGIVIRDRNGMSSRLVIGLIIAIGGALAASGPKSVETRTYQSGDYLITETTTTYHSEAEKEEIRRQTNETIDGLFKARFSDFELHLFSRDRFGRGDTSGYKANFLVGEGSDISFETGLGFGKADSIVNDANGVATRVNWRYLGMPFRVAAIVGPVRASLTYEWNWYKYGINAADRFVHPGSGPDVMQEVEATSHPWRLELSTSLLHRIALTTGATSQVLRQPKVGYFVTAGIFF